MKFEVNQISENFENPSLQIETSKMSKELDEEKTK
jgi:hypothetical protein